MAYAKLAIEAAGRWPNATAVKTRLGEITWTELTTQAARIAAGLRASGLKPGDRVAILADASARQAIFTIAASWAGLVVAPLNTRLSPAELVEIVEDAAVGAIASDDAHSAVGRTAAASFANCVRIEIGDRVDPDSLGWASMEAHAPIEAAPYDPEALAALIYTGGTTGRPKGVMQSGRSLEIEARVMADGLGYGPDAVYLHAMPVFHVAGLAQFLGMILAGGVSVFEPTSGVGPTFGAIRDLGVNTLCGAPTSIAMMLEASTEARRLLRGVRAFGYGAAPISEALLRTAIEAMPETRFIQFFGQTETCGSVSALLPDRHVVDGPLAGRLASVGRPHSHYDIVVADEEGRPLPVGDAGEILVRGQAVSMGYWRQPDLTAALFRDGWVRTGDVGRFDEEGFLYVVDRLKDMIVSGGENVFSSEVENVIGDHQEVEGCAVIGVPHPLWGEAVHAVVRLRPGAVVEESDLIDWCRARLGGYKCPKSVSFRSTPFPLSGVGKVMKTELRKDYATTL
ncbi:MAG: hypothetical protein A2792_13535 [Sphingomonadales bacterium RIFCSPHIGHO2_01_FULL_65_20]|nr:MAG: hypothetical protein A2792_13535 [Sphingomonadales bacterium RIFCSPHIGHO2_01_FULL_65_20]